MTRLILPFLMAIAACSAPSQPTNAGALPPERKREEPVEKRLAPDLAISFIQANLRLVLFGNGLALEASGSSGTLWDGPYPKEIEFVADEAWLYRVGPQDERRFGPSAGPVNPFAEARDQLPRDPIGGLGIKVVAASAQSAEVTVSGFVANSEAYAPITVKLDVRGPNP